MIFIQIAIDFRICVKNERKEILNTKIFKNHLLKQYNQVLFLYTVFKYRVYLWIRRRVNDDDDDLLQT